MTRSVKETINCDTCNADISHEYTSYPRKDILVVSCVNTALHADNTPIYSIAMEPLLVSDLHFCGFDCMKGYKE